MGKVMPKVFLGVGHGGEDPGAVGYVVEKDANLKTALACKEYLEHNDVQVKMSRYVDENDSLNEEIKECNEFNPALAVDIHNNAGKGDGFEIFYSIHGGLGKVLAENIEAEVKAIGQNSRGCKTKKNSRGKNYYGFIRETECPTVICEGAFVDNANDASQIDTDEECKAFGVAYAKGILKTLGITIKQETEPTTTSKEDVHYKLDTLRYGSTGNDVTIFEIIMKKMGYYNGKIDTDFGNGCVAACNAFQEDYPECGTNGEPDSVWGSKCWEKMFSLAEV